MAAPTISSKRHIHVELAARDFDAWQQALKQRGTGASELIRKWISREIQGQPSPTKPARRRGAQPGAAVA
jgi:hypothetical protein